LVAGDVGAVQQVVLGWRKSLPRIGAVRATIRRCGNVEKTTAITDFILRPGFARDTWNDNVKAMA
jgi:hypothetical protein